MDLNAVFRGSFSQPIQNGTGSGSTNTLTGAQLPDGLMNLLPLLGGLGSPLGRAFLLVIQSVGLTDLSLVVWIVAIFFLWRSGLQIWDGIVMAFFQRHFMTSITIDGHDDIFGHLMKWLAKQPRMSNSRNLAAETSYSFVWEDEDAEAAKLEGMDDGGGGNWLNFSSHEARSPPKYLPAHGKHTFWFRHRYFRLSRNKEATLDSSRAGGGSKDKESLTISTYGWSPDPIKQLIQHCKSEHYRGHYQRTTIKRPNGQAFRRYGSKYSWMTVANRPVRPMNTIVLDEVQKHQILSDMNEYLHPSTPRWYANRGIPLRRGYLFHGPPGTGKTSLSFALAGVFGLDIYVISLLEPTLSEEDLSALFNALPRRCVVLLEDIDTAGLGRSDSAEDEKERGEVAPMKGDAGTSSMPGGGSDDKGGNDAAKPKPNAPKEEFKDISKTESGKKEEKNKKSDENLIENLTKALRNSKVQSDERKGISLSGLLNAIDGVASHEGRVLIMTTNKPECLDEALIRPGRVDLQVSFGNATKVQTRELFQRMYEAESPRKIIRRVGEDASTHRSVSILRLYRVGVQYLFSRDEEKADQVEVEVKAEVKGEKDGKDQKDQKDQTNGQTKMKEQPVPCQPPWGSGGMTARAEPVSRSELEVIAVDFANRIPGRQFSPAEIQGFLLKRKKEPRRALAEVDAWVEGLVSQKANKIKVTRVH